MGMQEKLQELCNGFETAYIDKTSTSNLAYKPQFISNDYKQGKKVLSSIEDELMTCDQFQISVAFITMGGITPLLQILQELEEKGIKGEILTTNYLSFSEPEALKTLNALSNITLKMYDVDKSGEGFHTKGYIFRKAEIYRIIIGSSNITKTALTTNREWNTRIVSTSQGEMSKSVVDEFYELWNSKYALDFDEFYENYKKRYELIKKQRKLARSEEITSIEKYRLQPNSMQIGFITNLQKIVEAGEKRALLISATGTGKTYASAFAMRELGYKRVLFLVHRGQIAKQALESYKKVFDKSVSMGMVTGKHQDYNADYIFATIQTLSKEDVLEKYDRNAFDAIVIDEAHHSSAKSYKKVMTSDEAAQLKEYMSAVVEEGTGSVLRGRSYTVAGKTGTAEYSMSDGEKTHSWFMGFTNVDNPELVISVITEGSDGSSSGKAVSIAGEILDSYYN